MRFKIISGGSGLDPGVKDYGVILVFENDKALAQFLDSRRSSSSQADAAVKGSTAGSGYSVEVEVAPGVWVYQVRKDSYPSS